MTGMSKPVVVATLSPWGKAAAGSVAAMVANTLVYPLDIVKTRLQIQTKAEEAKTKDVEKQEGDSNEEEDDERYEGAVDGIKKIYKKGGIAGLYAGLPSSLLGVATTNFAYFYWYGLIRTTYMTRTNAKTLSTATELLLGALAGALAQIFTIPVSVVTTKQQTSRGKDNGFLTTVNKVIDEDGVTGLWRGLKASLILVINPSITYGSFERLKSLLFPNKTVLTAGENFLLGALSKAMATIATQPMIVAKVMQQSSDKSKRQYKTFMDALSYLYQKEGARGLFKGIGPQISKAVIVQGLLFMFKDQVELMMLLLVRMIKARRL